MEIGRGTVLDDRWELVERLASGGMGEVWRAVDATSAAAVAVKVLHPGTHEGEHRFAGEVESLRRLDHPNIVRMIDAGEHEGAGFLVMELVPARPLASLLEHRTLELDEARRLGEEIASALAYAHDRGIVNRDVTPANVLFDEQHAAKLADFGIALLAGAERITSTEITLGSAVYLAPEQITDEEIGPPADVYTLGLVLIEALTGTPAFTGPLKEAALARLGSDPEVPHWLPEPWRRLLGLMTAREPSARPSAAEVEQLLGSGAWQ